VLKLQVQVLPGDAAKHRKDFFFSPSTAVLILVMNKEYIMKTVQRRATKRLSLEARSNSTSKRAGDNRVVISLAPSDNEPWRGDQTVALTHREARTLQRFLNDSLG
jgi:hypothetical protein